MDGSYSYWKSRPNIWGKVPKVFCRFLTHTCHDYQTLGVFITNTLKSQCQNHCGISSFLVGLPLTFFWIRMGYDGMVISCDDCSRSRADVFFNLKLSVETPCKGEIRTSHKIVCKWRLFAEMKWPKTTAERKQQEIFWRKLVSFCWSNGLHKASVPCHVYGQFVHEISWNPHPSRFLMLLLWCNTIGWKHLLFGLKTVPAVLRCDSGLIGQESSSQYLGQRRNKHCNLMRLLLKHMDVMKRFRIFSRTVF